MIAFVTRNLIASDRFFVYCPTDETAFETSIRVYRGGEPVEEQAFERPIGIQPGWLMHVHKDPLPAPRVTRATTRPPDLPPVPRLRQAPREWSGRNFRRAG